MAEFPRGTIVAYYATEGAIPPGWAICDGRNGTPDLRGAFIRGVDDIGDVTGQKEGSDSHTHQFGTRSGAPVNGINHNCLQGDRGIDLAGNDHQHDVSGTTQGGSNVPIHVKLVFLMKV